MELRHALTYRLPRGKRSEPPLSQVVAPQNPAIVLGQPSKRRQLLRRRPSFWLTVPATADPVMQAVRTRVRFTPPRRTARLGVPFESVVVTPTTTSRSRPRIGGTRRGRSWEPVWPQQAAAIAPPYPTQWIKPRVKAGLLRRGKLADPPWPQASAPIPPSWPAQIVAARRIKTVLARRGRRSDVPAPQDTWTGATTRRAPRLIPTRRGRNAEPPWTLTVLAPPYSPSLVSARRTPRQVVIRRGRSSEPPWTITIVQPPPAYPPQNQRPRVKAAMARRGSRFDVTWGGPGTVTVTLQGLVNPQASPGQVNPKFT